MIGRRGHRIAERPCAIPRPHSGAPRRSGAPQHAGAPQPGVARHSARDPPRTPTRPRPPVGGGGMGRLPSAAASSPGKGAGPAEAPASPDRTKLTKLRPKPDNGRESRYDYTHYIGRCSMQGARQAP